MVAKAGKLRAALVVLVVVDSGQRRSRPGLASGLLELPVIRPWLARALAWPGLLACCPSKSPSGRC